MEVTGDRTAVLQQVNQFWSILDEMSQNNPEAYKTFIERQLREGAGCFSLPQPHCCLHTDLTDLQKPENGILYVNICGWKQVPAPTSHTQPVPVCGGKLETVTEEKEKYHIADVAFNPEVLQRAEGDTQEKEQLHLLALSFLQQQHKLSLSQHFTVTKAKLKGSVQDMKRRLTAQHQTKSSTPSPQTDLAPLLLQQISSLRMEETKEDSTIQLNIGGQEEAEARPGLIEVISSTESVHPQQPKHQMMVCSDSCDSTKSLKMRVELPGVCSISQCQLSITQEDVLLEVEEKYYLHRRFPESVSEETCCATFNKKKQVLNITASIL